MLPLLVRTTLQQAKQQQQQQVPWKDVLYKLVKGPMGCRPRRAAAVLQQVAQLEGAAAASGVVTQLLEAYTQLHSDTGEHAAKTAITHLAQVLLLMWLGACGEMVEQRLALVTPLQQACGVVPPQAESAMVQQGPQMSGPASWGPVRASLQAVVAAAAPAAQTSAAACGAGGSSISGAQPAPRCGLQKRYKEYLDHAVRRAVADFPVYVPSGVPPVMRAGGCPAELCHSSEQHDMSYTTPHSACTCVGKAYGASIA
jgi:hypothetical protein